METLLHRAQPSERLVFSVPRHDRISPSRHPKDGAGISSASKSDTLEREEPRASPANVRGQLPPRPRQIPKARSVRCRNPCSLWNRPRPGLFVLRVTVHPRPLTAVIPRWHGVSPSVPPLDEMEPSEKMLEASADPAGGESGNMRLQQEPSVCDVQTVVGLPPPLFSWRSFHFRNVWLVRPRREMVSVWGTLYRSTMKQARFGSFFGKCFRRLNLPSGFTPSLA